ncbi:response regulator [Pararhizobium sp. A13]|uniref:response regulator n=1 Tax=Pararhizobium sp. A13 TaxID=3133975 RepID=UPI00324FF441
MSNGLEPVVIVMIEDDEGHARLIEKNIRRAGVTNEIVPFTTGLKALSYLLGPDASGKVHEGKHLLILLDLNLPDMTGIDILARLRESEHLRRVMVIVLTTTDDPVEIHRCYDLGANVYVAKPVQYDKFVNAIQQLGLFLSVVAVPEVP